MDMETARARAHDLLHPYADDFVPLYLTLVKMVAHLYTIPGVMVIIEHEFGDDDHLHPNAIRALIPGGVAIVVYPIT